MNSSILALGHPPNRLIRAEPINFTVFEGYLWQYGTVCNYIYDEAKEKSNFPTSQRSGFAYRRPSVSLCDVSGRAAKKEKKAEYTVSDVLVNQIAAWGVKFFQYPWHFNVRCCGRHTKDRRKLRYIQVRHEETAAFMAWLMEIDWTWRLS